MDRAVVSAFISVVVLTLCEAAPTTTQSPDELFRAEAYLSQFFSIPGPSDSQARQITVGSFETSLKSMQEFFGLEVTGELDTNTLEVMSKPRCGVTDLARYGHFWGKPRWEKSVVTYRITEYTSDLSRNQVDSIIASAFKVYSDVIPLDFKQMYSGTADIMILFKARNHGDFSPFDGPGGVLAHASSPGEGEGGDTHFDEDEAWSLTERGINLFLVAAHEFGHALGLDHSRDRSALMFPTYQYVRTQGYKLPADDTRGVQALYGVRTPSQPDPKPQPKPDPKPQPKPDPKPQPKPDPKPQPKPDPKPQPKPQPKPDPKPKPEPRPEPPERCDRNLVFDAVTSIQNELYFFKNGYFWKKNGYFRGVTSQLVKSIWPQISSIDAAYEYKARNIAYFFEGDHYWGVRGNSVLPGYPKPLSKFGFPSSVKKIDAAVHVASTGRTLLFENRRYWSFNERKGKMDRGYPRYIYRDFPGIGSKVDAAFENYGYLYFSDGARQTEYYYPTRRVVRVLLNYGWLNCY